MSKKSKKIASDFKRKQRQAKKAAAKAKYASLAGSPENRKKKLGSAGKRLFRVQRHASGSCGNIGCSRCNKSSANYPPLAPSGSYLHKLLFTSSKWKV